MTRFAPNVKTWKSGEGPSNGEKEAYWKSLSKYDPSIMYDLISYRKAIARGELDAKPQMVLKPDGTPLLKSEATPKQWLKYIPKIRMTGDSRKGRASEPVPLEYYDSKEYLDLISRVD